jgi:linoleoyl-CoA desaturase
VTRNRALSPAELDEFARELDAVRARTVATLGQRDADYIRNVVKSVRYTGFAGRLLLMVAAVAGAFYPVVLLAGWIPGVLLLALSKILENMEVGHNVMHGQYDWMRDPALDGKTYEWDIAGTSEAWRQTHNYSHHTWTNVRGMDDDVGYGLLRIFPEQRWKPFYLLQPLVAVVFAILFEWGVAIQHLRLGRWFAGKVSARQMREQFRPAGRKTFTIDGKRVGSLGFEIVDAPGGKEWAGGIKVWLSEDARRIPFRIEISQSIASLQLDLKSVESCAFMQAAK